MSQLPTDRTIANTPTEHVDDHNELHRLHDLFETAYAAAVAAGFPADELEWIESLPGSIWRVGSGPPSNAVGIDGDFYLDSDTGDLYERSSGIYSIVFTVGGLPPNGVPGQVVTNTGPGTGAWENPTGGSSNLDGGEADTAYGGLIAIDCGGA